MAMPVSPPAHLNRSGSLLSPPMNPPGPQLLCPGNDMKVMPLQQRPLCPEPSAGENPREADAASPEHPASLPVCQVCGEATLDQGKRWVNARGAG